ncbi:MAG: glyoxalase [Dehalococcoidia bacterium]|nr:glyoxalase [Dehalococcoidia bacterium]
MPKVTGLGHVGLYVQDVPKMIDFYSNFLGLEVTDRGNGDWIVFLSARPNEEHHELALVRSTEQKTDAQQISFTVASLADLKGFYARIKERGYAIDSVVNHGIAFGCYFRDPEDNRVEVYWPTGKSYPQPHADPIDLEADDAALIDLLDNMPAKTSAGVEV